MKLFKAFLKVGFIFLLMSQFSCRKDFDTQISNGNLSFSVDTLFLDTVFNNLSTTTHLLTVYNRSKNDIVIPNIKLEKSDSRYRINVDGDEDGLGISTTEYENILIREKDSIFIEIEATISSTDSNDKMIYEDKILFASSEKTQEVNLVTLVKDVNFLFSNSGDDFDLTENTLTKEKPYVIYGNAIVPKNGNLSIEAGSTIHFSKDSSLKISEGATLNINGTLTDSIVFKSDRLSYQFDGVPGQWGGIKIAKNAQVSMNYLKILNPITGIEIIDNTNNININNTEIYNAANYGIYTENAKVTAQNLVIGQAGKSGLFLQGGDYNFNHATIANFWSNGIRGSRNLVLANYYFDENDVKVNAPLNTANFTNSIISGARDREIFLDKKEEEPIFNFNFKNCLLNTEKDEELGELYDTDNTSLYTNSLLNKKTDFKDTSENDLRIGLENEGINKADAANTALAPLDIIGTNRTASPDIGAYQHIDFTTLEPKDKDE